MTKAASFGGIVGLLAIGLLGCGDDGGSFKFGGKPVLEVYDGPLAVAMNGNVSVSGDIPASVRLKNTGDENLVIHSIETLSLPENVFVTMSSPMPTAAEPIVIEPGGHHDLTVSFDTSLPAGENPSATITLNTNATLSGSTRFVFHVTPQNASGRLMASPSTLDFKDVSAGASGILPLSLVNVGSASLEVSRFVLSGHTGYEITIQGVTYAINAETSAGIDLPTPLTIGATSSIELEVKYTASGPEEAAADLIFYSNDPTTPSGTPVRLLANVDGPCIVVTPERVEFGAKLVGAQSTIDVGIESCGEGELELQGIEMIETAGGVYTVDTSALTFPMVVPNDQKVTVPVQYLPTTTAVVDGSGQFVRDQGKLKVTSNAYLRDVMVDVSGFGTDGSCPTAMITCSEDHEVIPQTTLHCSALSSTGSNGSNITGYQWSVRQPGGSNEAIRPSTTQRDIQFTANIIGTYTLVLDVFDQFGTKSCAPAEFQVFVTSGEAIHVELIWRTPGDINETDTGFTLGGQSVGSDVDLHVLHPDASNYFDDVYDTYWLNKNPNWAGSGALDDPRLDRDDTDGAGPENFNLNQPQFNTTYLVGAHYWDDWSFGQAFTTVRVYIYGQLRFTWNEVVLKHHDMWDVCEIEWPSGNVTAIGGNTPSIRADFPIPF